ncbi:hypothetical protein VP01_842g3 [Puccinia sorghi]|uniref:Alpha-galactosidase n=1 Tax=Puccinia sorghi TaxID=27349 RepID=A0A0L6U9C3_9BASI|nr:hypothetical protein VP01_842g3 [Puccinia sorghi]
MSNRPTTFHQHSFAVKWIGIAVFALSTIGFTAQSPASKVTRRSPPSGPRPAMGWNSYWPFECGDNVKEEDLRKQADLLAEKGLVKAGYSTFVVECGWEDWPNDDGSPNVIQVKCFQRWLTAVLRLLAIQGLAPGSRYMGRVCDQPTRMKQICPRDPKEKFRGGDPPKDLKLYISKLVEWGMGYLSHRPCDLTSPDRLQYPDQASELNCDAEQSRYVQMEDAVKAAGVQIFYATGQWGESRETSNQKRANSWKVADDTRDNWNSFIRTLNGLVPFAHKTCAGSFNDLGLLQLGENKIYSPEKLTQFAFWSAAKYAISPLILSTDLSKLDQYSVDMLQRPGPLAVNGLISKLPLVPFPIQQDALGKAITLRRRYSGDKDIWSGPLSDGSTVAGELQLSLSDYGSNFLFRIKIIMIINWEDNTAQKAINLVDLGFASAHLYDVWTGRDLGAFNSRYKKLTETKPAAKRVFKRFPADMADTMGDARMREVTPGVKAVSQISPNGGGGVRWSNIPGSQTPGDTLVSFDFINAQLATGDEDDSKLNFKHTVITVNDKDKVYVDFPISGLLWEQVYEGFLVSLPLLVRVTTTFILYTVGPGEYNTILIEGVDEWAPDFVCLSVAQDPSQAS